MTTISLLRNLIGLFPLFSTIERGHSVSVNAKRFNGMGLIMVIEISPVQVKIPKESISYRLTTRVRTAPRSNGLKSFHLVGFCQRHRHRRGLHFRRFCPAPVLSFRFRQNSPVGVWDNQKRLVYSRRSGLQFLILPGFF